MQRSLSYKKPVSVLVFYVVLYLFYSSIATIYPFFPPLLGVLFFIYSKAMREEDLLVLFFTLIALLIFETNYGFALLSSIVYFYLQYSLILPKIKKYVSCKSCFNFLTLFLTYTGYLGFLTLIGNIFMLSLPSFSYYIIYYIVIEFFIVSLL